MDELDVRRPGASGDQAHDRSVGKTRRRREAEERRADRSDSY